MATGGGKESFIKLVVTSLVSCDLDTKVFVCSSFSSLCIDGKGPLPRIRHRWNIVVETFYMNSDKQNQSYNMFSLQTFKGTNRERRLESFWNRYQLRYKISDIFFAC